MLFYSIIFHFHDILLGLDELEPVVSEEEDDPESDVVEKAFHGILGGEDLAEALCWHRLCHGLAPLPRSVAGVTIILILTAVVLRPVSVVAAPLKSSPELLGLRFVLFVLVGLG